MDSSFQRCARTKNSCYIHQGQKPIFICRSPFCGFYKELCQKCLLTQQDHKDKFHLPIDQAQNHVQNRLLELEKGLIILKKEKQQKQKGNPITLPIQVQYKLKSIREIINQKINNFQKCLEDMYEKQVSMKLQSLSQTLRKSLDFLKREQNILKNSLNQPINLKKYFVNFQFWEHERKYYKSYMQQILEKQVKKFKQGFDDDNIMKLIVSFQANLKSIFSHTKQNSQRDSLQRPHAFLQQRNQLKKYEIVQKVYHLKPDFLGKPYPKQNYKWKGIPQSIYYPDLDCFFIFGEGKTVSNAILKYEDGKQNGNKKLSFIAQMYTKRSHFSTCLINGQIFIVGGYNDKEGCIAKCEKMAVSPKIKIYLVSSLEQRSALHTICNYKNKFILKFGGTSLMLNQLDSFRMQKGAKELYPQIYDIEKQQWRVVKYSIQKNQERLQFGLRPLLIVPFENDQNKIFVFGNESLQGDESANGKQNYKIKKKFQIKLNLTKNQIEIKICEGVYPINRKYELFPQVYLAVQKKSCWRVMTWDKTKLDNSIHLIDIKFQN